MRPDPTRPSPATAGDLDFHARGIPVWPGAHVRMDWSMEYLGEAGCDVVEEFVAEGIVLGRPEGDAEAHERWLWYAFDRRIGQDNRADVFLRPDLTHPDTRAAFDRRLALRLGCLEAVANQGVVVALSQVYGFASLELHAGWAAPGDGRGNGNYLCWSRGVDLSEWIPKNANMGPREPQIVDLELIARCIAWKIGAAYENGLQAYLNRTRPPGVTGPVGPTEAP